MSRHVLSAAGLAAATLALTVSGCTRPPVDIQDRTEKSAALQGFQSCAELETQLKDNLTEEMRVRLLQAEQQELSWMDGGFGPPVAEASADGAEAADGATRTEGEDFSGTNNQESGVDEADFVKTDGYFVYVLNGRRLETLSVPEFGELEHVSTVEVEGVPGQMLLDDDRIAVFSRVYTYDLPEDDPLRELVGDEGEQGWYWRGTTLTKLSVFDLGADRSDPTLAREVYIEGWLQTGREVEGTARLITYGHMDLPDLSYWPQTDEAYWNMPYGDPRKAGLLREATERTIERNTETIAGYTLENFLPRMYERKAGSVDTYAFTEEGCANFSIAEDGASRGVTSILTVDLADPVLDVEADHLVTNWSTIYASEDVLIVSEPSWDWWWFWGADHLDEQTNLHRFDISEPGQTEYTGSGRVPGTVLGQFALDEHEGTVRVATTTGRWNRWWLEEQDESRNHLFLLRGQEELLRVGEVRDLAVGERIWSARFTDETAYLVTFRNIDPLWTIDVSDATSPRVLGELHVPGVSTYLHPLDGDRLLTIGYAGDDEGLFWGQTQLSLFDVSDLSAPGLADTLGLTPVEGEDPAEDGWVSSFSEATYQHKAFQYWGPQRLLAVPVSTYRYDEGYEFVSKLKLVEVGGDSLSVHGELDHSAFFNDGEDDGWYWHNRDIRRTIFMGDYIYAISDRGVSVHRAEDLELMTQVALPGSGDAYGTYY